MRNHLISITARAADGTPVQVRCASINDSKACHLDGRQWDPALVDLPVLRYDFFGGAFQNAISVASGSFTLATGAMASFSPAQLAGLSFAGSRIRIWTGDLGDPFAFYRLRFDGMIAAEPEVENGIAAFAAVVRDAWLDEPVLQPYAGTGGIEGPEELAGTMKPLVLGACKFVPGVLIDPVDNVWQVSGYGPVQAISGAFDRLVSLGPSFGDYADMSALLAASIPNGRWATCLDLGLVRLGAPADGKLSFHVEGDAGGHVGFTPRAGAMIGRIAELAGEELARGPLDSLDYARPWDQGRVISSQVTARQLVQELVDSVGAVAGITHTGAFFVQPLRLTEAVGKLDASGGSLPLVTRVARLPLAAPFWRLATQAGITWQVHDLSEIASAFTPRGIYSSTRTYRLDDLVSASDGRTFTYTNAVPSAGNAPPARPATSNAYWALFNAADVTAQSQVTIEAIATVQIAASSDNVTTTDLSSVSRRIKVLKGTDDVSSAASFAVSALPGGIVAAFGTGADANLLGFSQADASGSVTVTATYEGVVFTAVVAVVRTKAAAAASGGAGNTSPVSDFTWNGISSDSFVALTDTDLIIQSNGSGALAFFAAATVQGGPEFQAGIKAQYSLDGSSWTDGSAGEEVSSEVEFFHGGAVPGYVVLSFTQTGLTPTTDYHVRLVGRRAGGLGNGSFYDADFTVRQP